MITFPGSLHNHTDYSNIRLKDAITKTPELFDYAIELGHKVLAITEHECLSNMVLAEEHYDKIKKEHSDFKYIRGNEIYLCRNGLTNENFVKGEDQYYHFILLALDLEGNKQLRELSTLAWKRSYFDRGMRRVPTYYEDIERIVGSNPGHIIGSTACIGGQLGQSILSFQENRTKEKYQKILDWCRHWDKIFGHDNFYLELQPSFNEEQIAVNKAILSISQLLDIPYIITCDAHYLKKEDARAHEIYLKSQEGEREVSEFYSATYLMSDKEVRNYLEGYMSDEQIELAYKNILDIYNKAEEYTIKKPLEIPQLIWKKSELQQVPQEYIDKIPNLNLFINSDFEGDNLLAKIIVENIIKDNTLQDEEVYNEVNLELQITWDSSQKNNAHWSSYFLNLQKIIDTVWEANSLVGCGRGSGVGFLLLYILGITQINPLRESTKTYPWRFLNPDRVSVLDVDFDVSGLKRQQVLDKFREVYGEDRVANVATFGTEKSKSAILAAAKGLGINNDTAQYIASLVPSDRGMIRTLKQCYFGDEEEGFSPIKDFVQEMNNNPELWKIAQKIEGIVSRIGTHAGGVIFVDKPFTESCSLMRSPDGTIVTAFELHASEKCSLIKYDALSVEAIDRIQTCLELLLKHGLIEDKGSLKENYENAIGIYNLERDNPEMWNMVKNHKIQALFQMEKASGIQGIELTNPRSVDDLAVLNSVIRLMAQEKGAEQPLNKFARFKEDISLWYQEMDKFGLTKEEQETLEPVLKLSYGICESQEKFMQLVQMPECGGFDLNWADSLRKAIAKKKPEDYKKLEKEYFERVEEKGLSKKMCNYVWHVLVGMSRGYGFNASHTLSYSLIGLQEMNLAFRFPIIFWDCANLIVDSGGTEEALTKGTGTNYAKMAIGINKTKSSGNTELSLVNINKSDFTFKPDEENNKIIFGLSGIAGVGKELIQEIIDSRPYSNLNDFIDKTSANRTAIISLIKAGAFDQFGERKDIMQEYLWKICEPKKRITLQNFNGLMEKGLLPEELNFQARVFRFNKLWKKNYKIDGMLVLATNNYYNFYEEFFDIDLLEPYGEKLAIKEDTWKKIYTRTMEPAKKYFKEHQQELLDKYNKILFQEQWDKYANGSYSKWEMDSLSMYYHDHELIEINKEYYNLVDFESLPREPIIEYQFKHGNINIPIFKTSRIIGTIIAKDDLHSSFTLLTPLGSVVTVRLNKDYFAKYNRRISELDETGVKRVKEAGWLQKGSLVMLNGIRRGDGFITKNYAKDKKAGKHQLCKITEVRPDGTMSFTNKRYGEFEEDEL